MYCLSGVVRIFIFVMMVVRRTVKIKVCVSPEAPELAKPRLHEIVSNRACKGNGVNVIFVIVNTMRANLWKHCIKLNG